ncbi:hypothetical protein KIM372_08970 [Bombiscardovia nodaiensis]|uniref:ABC3 transporter permease C-terminal domain-containing protein n=1 Tax=Bombiscardovia nodaiensis TaxID=2932181 RepID=A0ABM8B862_9BIFI|nr:hypothetical protein KIM372_08970 [Bombiscardovia nodaiensis]
MKWALNDLKANKGIWAGVLLVLVVTQTLLCAMGVSLGVDNYYVGLSKQTRDTAKSLGSGLSLVYFTAIVMGCLVIMQTLQASIRQRRQGLALLSLLGATPGQILFCTAVQVLALALIASLIAVALAPLLAPQILGFYVRSLQIYRPFDFVWDNFLRSALIGLGVGIGAALVATRLTLRELKTVSPIQALGRAQGMSPYRTPGMVEASPYSSRPWSFYCCRSLPTFTWLAPISKL